MLLDKFGVHHTVAFDGSPALGINREHGVDLFVRCRGCPRNCKRRAKRQIATEQSGRRREATTREPGDLPQRGRARRIGRGRPMEVGS
jgi:hypothetical protein